MQEFTLFQTIQDSFYPVERVCMDVFYQQALRFIPDHMIMWPYSEIQLAIQQNKEAVFHDLNTKVIEEKDYLDFEQTSEWAKWLLSFLPEKNENFEKIVVVSCILGLRKECLGQGYIEFLKQYGESKNRKNGTQSHLLDLTKFIEFTTETIEEKAKTSQNIVDIYQTLSDKLKQLRLARLPENLQDYPTIMKLCQDLERLNGFLQLIEVNQETASKVLDIMPKYLEELQNSSGNPVPYFAYLRFVSVAYSTYRLSMKTLISDRLHERSLCQFLISEGSPIGAEIDPLIVQNLQRHFERENEEILQLAKLSDIHQQTTTDNTLAMNMASSGQVAVYLNLLGHIKELLSYTTIPCLTPLTLNVFHTSFNDCLVFINRGVFKQVVENGDMYSVLEATCDFDVDQNLTSPDFNKNLVEKLTQAFEALSVDLQENHPLALVTKTVEEKIRPLLIGLELVVLKAFQIFMKGQIEDLNQKLQTQLSQLQQGEEEVCTEISDQIRSSFRFLQIFKLQENIGEELLEIPNVTNLQEIIDHINKLSDEYEKLQALEKEKKQTLLESQLEKTAISAMQSLHL